MRLTPSTLRNDKRCGQSGIPDNRKCTKTTAAGSTPANSSTTKSVSPDYLKLGLGLTISASVAVVGLSAVDDVVRTRSRQYGEPTFSTFRRPFGEADLYVNAPNKKVIAAGAFGQTSFTEVGGKRFVVKEPQQPTKESRKSMAAGLSVKATRNLYRAQGRITQSEVANARLAGDIGIAPRVVAASRRALVTEVANGAPIKEFNDTNKRKLNQTLAKLHRAGIAHNDLKGDNVFEDSKTGSLQLIDFGLSQRDSSAVAREWYRAMNPPSPNVLLAVTGTTTGSFNLKGLNPTGYSRASKALSKVVGGELSEDRIIQAGRNPRTARQMQRVIDNFYEGKYNMRQDSARLDKKCGASGIPDNAKCTKGGSWPQAATIGAALTAGGIAAFALTRGGPNTAPASTSSTPSGPPRLPGYTPRALLASGAPRKSKTQRMRENTTAAMRNAEGRIAQTAREEVRRVAQIGNTMAAAGEATGMAAKTGLRELRLRTEAARRRFEPGYRSTPASAAQPPKRLSPETAAIQRDPRTGQPRRRRAQGFGRTDNYIQYYAPTQLRPPTRRDTEDGKKYSKTVTNPETGRKNKVRYGAKGYRIAPGTDKGDNYCARSFGDMKSHGKDCSGPDRNTPLCLSRAKWKCSGKSSRRDGLTPEKFSA